jgi:hypothetical protein
VQLQLWLPDSVLQAALGSHQQPAAALAIFLCPSEPAAMAGQEQEAAAGVSTSTTQAVPAGLDVEQVLLLFLPTAVYHELSDWVTSHQLEVSLGAGLLGDVGVLLDTLQLVQAPEASCAAAGGSQQLEDSHRPGQVLHQQLKGMVKDAVSAAEGLQRYLHSMQLPATSQLVACCHQELLQSLG